MTTDDVMKTVAGHFAAGRPRGAVAAYKPGCHPWLLFVLGVGPIGPGCPAARAAVDRLRRRIRDAGYEVGRDVVAVPGGWAFKMGALGDRDAKGMEDLVERIIKECSPVVPAESG